MKKRTFVFFKYGFILSICFSIIVGMSPLKAETLPTEDTAMPSTMVINGEVKRVREVTLREYLDDTSDDILIVVNKSADDLPDISKLSDFNPKEVAMYVAGVFVGWVLEQGFLYVWNSGVIQSAALKAYAALIAAFPLGWLLAVATVAIVAVVIVSSTQTVYAPTSIKNSSGCVWSGRNSLSGVWHCPYRIAV